MIKLNQHSIYVQLANGETVPLLAKDAAQIFCGKQPPAACIEPWQMEEIAEALIYHLQTNLKRDTIESTNFVEALAKLAMVCGCNSVKVVPESVHSADLYRLARDTGYGFELAFFQSIERSIQDFRQRNARLVRFVGLRSCVKLLLGAKNWGKTRQRLHDEIVEYIRSHMLRRAADGPILFAVS